jgi:hypothetical protein
LWLSDGTCSMYIKAVADNVMFHLQHYLYNICFKNQIIYSLRVSPQTPMKKFGRAPAGRSYITSDGYSSAASNRKEPGWDRGQSMSFVVSHVTLRWVPIRVRLYFPAICHTTNVPHSSYAGWTVGCFRDHSCIPPWEYGNKLKLIATRY